MTTAKQVFLENVLRTMKNANECLPNHPGDLREKLEYFDEIIGAWEELTGEQFAPKGRGSIMRTEPTQIKPKWAVTARSYDRKTIEPTADFRTEILFSDNDMFTGIEDEGWVKEVYESYWNDVDPNSLDVVIVSHVEKVTDSREKESQS